MTASEADVDLDTAKLESFLSDAIDVAVTDTEVLHDGLNLSVAISTADDERAYVLRRPNKLRHTDIFDDLGTEYRVLQGLEDTAINAPSPVLFCEDDSVLDDSFFVMTHLDGVAVPLGTDLPEEYRDAESRRDVAYNLIDVLAEIHLLDTASFEDVCEHQSAREQVEHGLDRLDEATSVTGHEVPTLRSVGEWLLQNAPSDPRTSDRQTTLVHGDFRPGNVLLGETERPEITGVLDWETAMLGDPLTELGYLLLRWGDEEDPTLSLDELEAEYSNEEAIADLREMNEYGLAPFTTKPGSPTRRELVARYEEQTGISFENDRFYRAHAAFMLATVWSDLHRYQVEAGAESAKEPYVEYVAMMAERIVSGDFEL